MLKGSLTRDFSTSSFFHVRTAVSIRFFVFIAGKLSTGVNDTGDTLSTVALLPALNNAGVIDNDN
jgi:hypothetical protein